jgi:tetratricopeptide (TPR) repeat protein
LTPKKNQSYELKSIKEIKMKQEQLAITLESITDTYCVEILPENEAIKAALKPAQLRINKRQYNAAIIALKKILKDHPCSPSIRVWLAQANIAQGEWEHAVIWCEEALEVSPFIGSAYLLLGLYRRRRMELPEALDCFIKGLSVEPNDREMRFSLARTLWDLGRFDEAIVQAEIAVVISEDEIMHHMYLLVLNYWYCLKGTSSDLDDALKSLTTLEALKSSAPGFKELYKVIAADASRILALYRH